MILFIEKIKGKREHFNIRSFRDFYPLVQSYPMIQTIVMHSHTLKEAAENVANYISSHHIDSWVEDEGLAKNLKTKLLGAGLLASSAFAPTSEPIAQDPGIPPTHVNFETCDMPQDSYLPYGKHRTDPFLWNLMQIESSGGKDTKHTLVQSGPSKGETAIGRWGLLRPTVQEIIRRQVKDKTIDPKILNIYNDSQDKMGGFFQKHPHLELELARYLADHVLTNNNNNYESGAYAWLNGHNLKDVDHKNIKDHYYVEKYRDFDKVNPFKKGFEKAEQDFAAKLERWAKTRDLMTNELMPNFNRQMDYRGRLAEDKPKPKEGAIGELEDSIADAKKLSKP